MEQALQDNNFKRCFLIIVGTQKSLWSKGEMVRKKIGFNPYSKWTLNSHTGSLVSMSVNFPNIHIIQVENDSQFVYAVKRIIERTMNMQPMTHMDTELFYGKMNTSDIKLKMLSCIPKLGLEKCKSLYNSVDIRIISKTGKLLTNKDVCGLKGIGPKIAQEIIKINK